MNPDYLREKIHSMRSPLTCIAGLAEIGSASNLEESPEIFKQIIQETRRLSRMIAEFSAEVENDRFKLEPVKVCEVPFQNN